MQDAAYWIDKLALNPHPEGGYYAEVYHSTEVITPEGLPRRFTSERPVSTSLYYWLNGNQVSHFHRIKIDEIWHFYAGAGLSIFTLDSEGCADELKLGRRLDKGETFQRTVTAGLWLGASLTDLASYALVGCTVAPGFHFDDFESADRQALLTMYPQHESLIHTLTR